MKTQRYSRLIRQVRCHLCHDTYNNHTELTVHMNDKHRGFVNNLFTWARGQEAERDAEQRFNAANKTL